MNKIKMNAIKVKNHIERNKVAYAASTIAVLAVWLQQSNVKEFRKFLATKGIDEIEYFNPEYYAELNAQKELA